MQPKKVQTKSVTTRAPRVAFSVTGTHAHHASYHRTSGGDKDISGEILIGWPTENKPET